MYYPFDVSVLCITLLDVSALTSAVMKVCERVVLCKLEKLGYSLLTGKTGVLMMRFYTV